MKKTVFIIIASLSMISAHAQKMTCKDLVAYRDGTLFRAWEKEFRKYDAFSFQRSVIKEEMAELKTLGKQSDWGAIALSIKTVTDVMSNTLKLGKALSAVNKVKGKADKVLKGVNITRSLLDKSVQEESEAATWEALGNDIAEAIPIINNLKATLDNMKTFQEYSKAKNSINSQLDRVEKQLAKVESKLKQSQQNFNTINNIKTQIDVYLRKNCK